jgi:hypothetical protein
MPTSTTATVTNDASTLSPEALEANLLHHLASVSALDDLHASLLASLQRAGWTERVRSLSLELLRAGRCERFDDVLDAVVALAEGRTHPAVNGDSNSTRGVNNSNNNGARGPDTYFENIDLRIPRTVVEQGVKAVKEALREVVEDDGDLILDRDGEPPQVATSTKKKAKDPNDGDHTTTTPHVKQEKSKIMAKESTVAINHNNTRSLASVKDSSAAKPLLKNGDTSSAKRPTKDRKPRASGKDSQAKLVASAAELKPGGKT